MLDPQITVENIISGAELPVFQNIGVQEALLNKKMLLAFDTGTGKTFTYSFFVRGLLNRNPDKKHIFVIIHDSLKQAPADIRNMTGVPVGAFSSSYEDLSKLMSLWSKLSIIVITYECFRSMDAVLFLYKNLPYIESITIDEAHHVSNWDESNTAFMIRAICHHVPYIVALSATPMTSREAQYFQIMNLLDRSLSSHRDETPLGKYERRYLPVNRDEYNIKGRYKSRLELVVPQQNQIGKIHGVVSRVVKGTGAINQVQALMRIIREKKQQGKRVIVYVHYHDTRNWVEQHFTDGNISYVSLHGKITKMSDRQKSLDKFSQGKVDVLITSVAESLNIDADVVIFYEFTTKLKQVMGRAHRGLEEKELELIFIITKDTDEVDYFMEYIYKRSLSIQNLLRKDYSEFIRIGEELKRIQNSDD